MTVFDVMPFQTLVSPAPEKKLRKILLTVGSKVPKPEIYETSQETEVEVYQVKRPEEAKEVARRIVRPRRILSAETLGKPGVVSEPPKPPPEGK